MLNHELKQLTLFESLGTQCSKQKQNCGSECEGDDDDSDMDSVSNASIKNELPNNRDTLCEY